MSTCASWRRKLSSDFPSDQATATEATKPGDPRNHHYIPRFLLAQWTSPPDGRLVRYDMPHPGKLVQSRRFPTQVGWCRDLYRIPGDGEHPDQWLEHEVFQRIDSVAAKSLTTMLGPNPTELTHQEMTAWVLLIRSLMHRTPENLARTKAAIGRINEHLSAEIRENYDELRTPNDPATLTEFEARTHPDANEHFARDLLAGMMGHERIGTFLLNMRWRIFALSSDCPSLLLSDDPVARTNGLAASNGHLAMPLSPRRLLVLANSPETLATITALTPRQLATEMNKWTVESARRFVAAVDRSQERFIRNRFGKDPKPSLMANLDQIDKMYVEGDAIRRRRAAREVASEAT